MASIEDYTIACICALTIEAVALRSFLDEEHPCPEIPSTHASTQDRNVYSTGAIRGHKIVVATLPDGKYGVTQATSVIDNMIRSFPNLRCCFMVGIGGGAPSSQHDIRLGDVVVSKPYGRSGGIIQWDHGKATQGQPFLITQHLNEPPSLLLSAIGKLAQDYELDEHPLHNMIEEVLKNKSGQFKAKYKRPDDSSDRLYRSDVIHPSDTHSKCELVCGTEVSKLVERSTRVAGAGVAEIYHGIIASGSSLMKDATVRDRLSKEEGVLCFETEAAGLMNQFPCMVIRGICDYSDSHKNDDWQRYAAMIAAAYTKEILRVLMPGKVEQAFDRLSKKLNDIDKCVQNLATNQREIQDSETRKRLLDWIPSDDYSGRQNALQQEIQEGTGQWFLNDANFLSWLRRKGGMLYCTGMPGAGKTHIASLVIHHLQSLRNHDSTPVLAYIYCEYTHKLTRQTLLGGLLKQLVRMLHPLPAELIDLYKNVKDIGRPPLVGELKEVLRSIVSSSERCFIVVDGLDECTDDEGMNSFLLETLTELRQSSDASILTLCRNVQHIRNHFSGQGCLEIEVKAPDHDISVYLDHQIPRVLPLLAEDKDLCHKIRHVIMAAASGMFLLAMLHVNSLKGKINAKAIEDALTEIRSGGNSLVGAYDKTMRMIESQVKGHRKLAMHTLAWVAFSSAPLTVEELQHALAIETGQTHLNFDNITKLEMILSTCAGLINIQVNSGTRVTVHLVHETTQGYFLETQEKHFRNVRTRLACLSLTYLTFQAFESGRCKSYSELALRKVQYPFYIYLGWSLSGFIQGNEKDHRVKTMLERFFLGDGYVAAHVQVQGEIQWNSPGSNALHLAILFRLGSLLPLLTHRWADECNDAGLKPLHLAVEEGYWEGIEYLLSAPEVDCNATSDTKRTALTQACEAGDEDSVKLLLACSEIDCNLADGTGATPLDYVLMKGGLAADGIVGMDDESTYASCLAELLDKPNLNINRMDSKGRIPLVWCIEKRYAAMALLLLSREDVDLNLPDDMDPNILFQAAKWNHPDILERVLDMMGSELLAKDRNYRTALDHAAEHGSWLAVERLLIDYKTKIRIKHRFADTALFYAIKQGSPQIVSRVLNQVALDKSWWFLDALSLSMEYDRLETFMILKMKLGVWMRENPRWLTICLLRAAEKGVDRTLATMLEYARYNTAGIEKEHVVIPTDRTWDCVNICEAVSEMPFTSFDVQDSLGQTALHAAARRSDAVTTRILLAMGVNVNVRDATGRTASEVASIPFAFKYMRNSRLDVSDVAHPREQPRDGM